MPKKIKLLLFFAAIALLFTECKKGEGDPSLSLRSRKARLSGAWRLQSGSASYTGDAYNESYTFDGTNVKVNVTSYNPVVYIGKYTLNLTVNKDGSFSFNENYAGSVLEVSGIWNFNAGVGEAKKKEEAIFTINKVKKGYTNGDNLFNHRSVYFVYKITELRNKKLVISCTGKLYTDSRGKYSTFSTEYTFIQ